MKNIYLVVVFFLIACGHPEYEPDPNPNLSVQPGFYVVTMNRDTDTQGCGVYPDECIRHWTFEKKNNITTVNVEGVDLYSTDGSYFTGVKTIENGICDLHITVMSNLYRTEAGFTGDGQVNVDGGDLGFCGTCTDLVYLEGELIQ